MGIKKLHIILILCGLLVKGRASGWVSGPLRSWVDTLFLLRLDSLWHNGDLTIGTWVRIRNLLFIVKMISWIFWLQIACILKIIFRSNRTDRTPSGIERIEVVPFYHPIRLPEEMFKNIGITYHSIYIRMKASWRRLVRLCPAHSHLLHK